MKIKCIIVDDEQPARDLLESYVEKFPGLELVAKCKSPLEAISIIQDKPIDLMFLDIQMPELKGTEMLQSIKSKPVVIFTTAYQEYALEGYELDVIDYMLKPISFDRFIKGVTKAVDQIRLIKQQAQPSQQYPEENHEKEYITVKADHKIHKLNYDDIIYIEGLKEYVSFYTKDKKRIVYESLKNLEEILPAKLFMRIHKSYIVNTSKVTSLYGNQLEIKGKYLPIGQMYKSKVVERLF